MTADDLTKSRQLRQRAERLLEPVSEATEGLTGMSSHDIARLVHELRVHQIELKMQNDELRRIQAELEKARDRYVHLYDFAPVAYFTVDEQGAVVEANLTAATLLQSERKAIVGPRFSRFVHRQDQDAWHLHRKRLLETADYQSFPLRLVKRDGGEPLVNLECTLVEDPHRKTTHIRIAATDISQLKRAEEALQQANANLEQRVAERTCEVGQRNVQLQRLAVELSSVEDRERRRIAMILHDDLQQRLASLRFKVWAIFPKDKVDEQAGEKISDLDKDILESINISRSLSIELSPPVLRQNGLKAALAWLAKDMQSRHGLSVALTATKEADPESPALASVLFRTVNELLFNIVKHAGVGAAQVDVRLEDDLIVISVADQGKGFDAAVFHAGQNAGETFGLFSIEERIKILGGTVAIDSVPGKGCRIVISIPRGDPVRSETGVEHSVARADVGPESITAPPGGHKVRLLVADDHPTMREELVNLLKNKGGFEVIAQAENGHEAVRLSKEHTPDLILMDVSMPELDGVQATAQISRTQPCVCIVGLSLHDDEATRQRMLAAGATDLLSKSCQSKALLESIHHIADQWKRDRINCLVTQRMPFKL